MRSSVQLPAIAARAAVALATASAVATLACGASIPPPGGQPGGGAGQPLRLELAPAVGGFTNPLDLQQPADGSGRLFVVEQGGKVRIVDVDGTVPATPFLDVATRPGFTSGGETGLLGLAFHPGYAANGRFFVNYTRAVAGQLQTVIAEFTASPASTGTVDAASERILFTVDQPFANHNGGGLAFGPDGSLYIGLGDGGSAGDPFCNAQNLNTLLGKLLRIDVNSRPAPGQQYAVPSGNPFANQSGARGEIWLYGLRNPFRFSFDRATGDLYIGDVGQDRFEEVDLLAAQQGGVNLGWNFFEGSHSFSSACTQTGNAPVPPIFDYGHEAGDTTVTGGYVYRGREVPGLAGAYVFGDFGSGRVWTLTRDTADRWTRSADALLSMGPDNLSSFGETQDGELYVVRYSSGEVARIRAATRGRGAAERAAGRGRQKTRMRRASCEDPRVHHLPMTPANSSSVGRVSRMFVLAVLAGAAIVASAAAPARPPEASSDWPAFGRDPARSNSSSAPTGIDATNVSSLRRQQVRLDGTVDASAIYLHGARVKGAAHDVFFVTTTYGKTIAIDANDGAALWEHTPPGYESWAGSYRVTTATPVADADRQSVYAASPDGHVQKLAVADGRVLWSTAITRLPEREKIASALGFFGGRVIAVTGGYIGDRPPYQGHVAVLDAAKGDLLHVWNALCSDRAQLIDPRSCSSSGAAIWGRAGAVVDTGSGSIFVATGNGRWNGRTDWGDAALQLDRDATRVEGNYTPQNTEELDAGDRDVGSTSPVLLGGGFIAQGGKDGRIRLLNLQRIAGAAPHRGGEAQVVSTPSGGDLFTAPAVLHAGSGTWLFAADNGATAAWILQDGRLVQKWNVSAAGTSPVVAGGLLYVYDPSGGLRVRDPQTGRQLARLDCGEGHWNSPIVVDGRIALPEGNSNRHETSGVLDIWRTPGR